MPDISYCQSNFSAGEWSPPFQGRIDDKEYFSALKLCLNYIPNQESSLSARSGFKRCGITKYGSPAKLLSFRFSNFEPYVSEFTSENLRFWANGYPIFTQETASFVSVVGDPPVFKIQDNRYAGTGLVPSEWANGDSIMIQMSTTADIVSAGYLAQREFTITIVSAPAGTLTLSDAITGSPLSGAVTMSGIALFQRIQDIPTYYDYIEDIRQVAFAGGQTSSAQVTEDNIAAAHRVSYLQALIVPTTLKYGPSVNAGKVGPLTLTQERFIDGPYLDSPGTDIPLLVSAITGEITVKMHGYSTAIYYRNEDVTWSGTDLSTALYFVSIANNNLNNALPTPPAATPFWASMPLFWSAATTYFLGQPAMGGPVSSNGVATIYYSIQAANLNHVLTDGAWWDTTPPAYAGGTTYSDGAVVVDASINYVSLVGGNIGHTPASSPTFWLPVDLEAALDEIQNISTGWPSQAKFASNDPGGGNDGIGNNPPRLFRMKAGPQPWVSVATYAADILVNYKDNIFKSLQAANTGKIPDQEADWWEVQSRTVLWTWGEIVDVTDAYTATILIKGDDLPDINPVWEFRMGLYSDTTGWPTCGTYHEGRLWFAGTLPNRFDAGRSNKGYDFSPTATDGTVADNNAISYTLNAEENETIYSIASITEGIILTTNEAEWLVSASSLNDPLTPTSIQAHRTTAFSSAQEEITRLPTGIAVIQKGGRRLLEYRTFIDMTSYQSRLNTSDLTRKCQHLTQDGIVQTQYQRLPQPVIWGIPGGAVTGAEYAGLCPVPIPQVQVTHEASRGTLFGLGYARTPDVNYVAPFSFEHGISYARSIQQDIGAIAVQQGWIATAEFLYTTRLDNVDGLFRVEMLMPVFESTPLEDTFDGGGLVSTFGNLSKAYFVDSGMTPAACKLALDGLSCTFYGMFNLAGATVQFTCRGKYVGNYTIAADGSVTVAFITGTFEKTDVGRAMYTVPNATLLPASFQSFRLDVNGNSGVLNPSVATTGFYGQFGYKYRRRGQMLRPATPGANGPHFAKIRRNERMGVYVEAANEISIGDTFSTLFPLELKVPRSDGKESSVDVGPADFVTGIFRDEVTGDYTFDGYLCWEQTDPVPGSVLAVGGFEDLTDA